MKDIVFTPKRQKKELRIFGMCFIIAFLMNLIAIIIYKTSWIEIISQIGYVFVIAVVIYLIFAFFRSVIKWIGKVFRKNKK